MKWVRGVQLRFNSVCYLHRFLYLTSIVTKIEGLAAHYSKGNRKASLLSFGCRQPAVRGERVDSCHKVKLPPPTTDNQWVRALIDRARELHAETAQSALTVILKLIMQWSDQCHLDCFKYS